MKTILYIGKPKLSTYTIYGATTGMLANDKRLDRWLANNMININYDHTNAKCFYNIHYPLSRFANYLIKYYSIPRRLLRQYPGDLKDFIYGCLKNEEYIYMFINLFYAPFSKHYMKKDRIHEIFIYGIDLEEQCVLFAANAKDGKFIHDTMGFDTLEACFYNREMEEKSYKQDISLFKINKNYVVPMDLEKIKLYMKQYIKGEKGTVVAKETRKIYGIHVYQAISNDLYKVKASMKPLKSQNYHFLYEHKKLMSLRLAMIKEMGVDISSELIKKSNEIKDQHYMILNYALKYNRSKNVKVLDKIIHTMAVITEVERSLYTDVINGIKKYEEEKGNEGIINFSYV